MRFHANYVSTSVFGDYYQAMFEAEQDSDDVDSPYLLVQRQFEDPTIGAISRRMTRITSGIFICAVSSSRLRICQLSSIDRGTILSALPLLWRLRTSRMRHAW